MNTAAQLFDLLAFFLVTPEFVGEQRLTQLRQTLRSYRLGGWPNATVVALLILANVVSIYNKDALPAHPRVSTALRDADMTVACIGTSTLAATNLGYVLAYRSRLFVAGVAFFILARAFSIIGIAQRFRADEIARES